ncbi:MAG: IS1595 family transposase [Sphingobacteriales bacterium JAD_PAG50586_3]|nr:MAG: IS1595 family transposase [Sphingobacteriales bacterium JAD_PAG50586_3]
MFSEVSSLYGLSKAFPTELSCIKYLEKWRWKGIVISPFDPDSMVYKCKNNRYYCVNTNKYFNVKTGTIFENTKIELGKWFLAIWLITTKKRGINAHDIARDCKVTLKTAWFLLHRIRKGFAFENDGVLEGEIECDESFFGGKNKNRHADKKYEKCQGRSFKDKAPVLGMLERGGRLICRVLKDTKTWDITPVVRTHISINATLFTDEWAGYNEAEEVFGYERHFVSHSKKEYANGNITTNRIENVWSNMKRGIFGVYIKSTKKHLHRYMDEFVFRYNTKKKTDGYRFNYYLENLQNTRLRYKDLVADVQIRPNRF